MKMIRFENVCDSIREAMFRFYMEQTCFDRDVCVEKIEKLVDRTFDAKFLILILRSVIFHVLLLWLMSIQRRFFQCI